MWGSYTRGKRVEASLASSLELHLRAQPPQPSKEAVGFQPQALKNLIIHTMTQLILKENMKTPSSKGPGVIC